MSNSHSKYPGYKFPEAGDKFSQVPHEEYGRYGGVWAFDKIEVTHVTLSHDNHLFIRYTVEGPCGTGYMYETERNWVLRSKCLKRTKIKA